MAVRVIVGSVFRFARRSVTAKGWPKEGSCTGEFGRNRAKKSGLADYCRSCHNRVTAEGIAKDHGSGRSYQLKRRYGLTEDVVSAEMRRQGGYCLICLHRRDLHVDHDHDSGEFRGMLCFRCNGALGQFKDDPRIMRRAVDYLEARLAGHYAPQPRRLGRALASGKAKSSRHYHLYRRYGFGADEVQALIDRQNGTCPICREAPAVHVDHDHVTLAARGVLCPDCNTGMGQLGDDSSVLRRAVEYLTGGLFGLREVEEAGFEVAVVRPCRSADAVDAGWDLARECTDDLAVLDALARGGPGEPWETDVAIGADESFEARFPILDLSEPVVDETLPREAPEYAGVPEG